MASKSVSVRGETYEAFKAKCTELGVSQSQQLGREVNFFLDVAEAAKKADTEAATRTVVELGMTWPSAPNRGEKVPDWYCDQGHLHCQDDHETLACPGPNCQRPGCTCVCHKDID